MSDLNAAGPARCPAVREMLRGAGTAALALALACGPADTDRPPWPDGALLSADRAALARLLEQLEALERTPLARLAADLRAALPACETVEAIAPDSLQLRGSVRCAEPVGPLAGLHDYRGDASLAWVAPAAEPGNPLRLRLRASERDEHLHVEVDWPVPGDREPLASLLPGSEAAGPPLLTGRDRVLHARVRSETLDLAGLVPEDSQADQLFRLRSALFSKALFDDTWELAMYAPSEGTESPRLALAIGVRARAAAQAALEHFLDELESAWSLQRTALPWAPGGACLPELKLMPGLAPCALAREHALVIGWNADSLRHALAETSTELPGDAAARIELDLARLQHTDHQLAAPFGSEALLRVTRWPWQRVLARGERRGDHIAFEIELTSVQETQGS